jgi:Asp-tRNA(Asn)/Glu-tRNA(Gln) amidotransferase A subunit family amidase
VRCGEQAGLPINVQVVGKAWQEMTVLAVCRALESELGGWQAPLTKAAKRRARRARPQVLEPRTAGLSK